MSTTISSTGPLTFTTVKNKFKEATGLVQKTLIGNIDTSESSILPAKNVHLLQCTDNTPYLTEHPIWNVGIAGTTATSNMALRNIHADSSGSIYVSGTYTDTSAIYNAGNSLNTTVSLKTPTSGAAAYCMKVDSSGTVQSTVVIDGASADNGVCASVDSQGNLYLGGFYQGTGIIHNVGNVVSTVAMRGATGSSAYAVKYNPTGTAEWVVSVDGASADSTNAIATDTENNIYVSGQYATTATIYNAGLVASTNVSFNITSAPTAAFVVKYNNSGIAQWCGSIGGGTLANKVATDSGNNIYMSGWYNTTAVIYQAGAVTSTSVNFPTASSLAGFVIKYDSSGNALWRIAIDGSTSEQVMDIHLNAANNIFVSGVFNSTSNIIVHNADGTTQSIPATTGSSQGFIIKFDSMGVYQWAIRIANSIYVTNIALDSSGNIFASLSVPTTSTTIITNADGSTTQFDISYGVLKFNSLGIAQRGIIGPETITYLTTDKDGGLYIGTTSSTVPIRPFTSAPTWSLRQLNVIKYFEQSKLTPFYYLIPSTDTEGIHKTIVNISSTDSAPVQYKTVGGDPMIIPQNTKCTFAQVNGEYILQSKNEAIYKSF